MVLQELQAKVKELDSLNSKLQKMDAQAQKQIEGLRGSLEHEQHRHSQTRQELQIAETDIAALKHALVGLLDSLLKASSSKLTTVPQSLWLRL